MKGFKCTLSDSYTNEIIAIVLIKAESYNEAFLKVNENYCLNSDFVIDEMIEIPIEEVKI